MSQTGLRKLAADTVGSIEYFTAWSFIDEVDFNTKLWEVPLMLWKGVLYEQL
jgi:hypothetical protein